MSNDNLFRFEELVKFFKEYPIDEHIAVYERSHIYRYGGSNPYKLTDYLKAFKQQSESGNNVMKEYVLILNTLLKIRDFKELYFKSYSYYNRLYMDIDYDEFVNHCYYIINYKGFWNIDELMDRVGLSKEILLNDCHEINHNFPTERASHNEKVKKSRENRVNEYYKKKRLLSSDQMDDIFKNLIGKSFLKKNRINKNNLNITNVKYPVLLILFKDDEAVYITKVTSKLVERLLGCISKQNFDSYFYSYFSEDTIDDVYAEFLVRYNPKNVRQATIGLKNSIYRSLNHIKERYRGVKDIDMRVIKNVIEIYEIPIYYLNSGQIVVDKDLIDNAIQNYYGSIESLE